MIDKVIKRAETEVEHKANLLEQLKQEAIRLEEQIQMLRLELLGWEAYLEVLQKQCRPVKG